MRLFPLAGGELLGGGAGGGTGGGLTGSGGHSIDDTVGLQVADGQALADSGITLGPATDGQADAAGFVGDLDDVVAADDTLALGGASEDGPRYGGRRRLDSGVRSGRGRGAMAALRTTTRRSPAGFAQSRPD
jgi:hypothetical protein